MSGAKVLAFRELIREVPIAAHVRDFASDDRDGDAPAVGATRRR